MRIKTFLFRNIKTTPNGDEIAGLTLLVAAGLVYLVSSFFKSEFFFALSQHLSAASMTKVDTLFGRQLVASATILPTLALIFVECCRKESITRKLLYGPARGAVASALATLFVSMLLNALSLWPFTWRWSGNGSAAYAKFLIVHSDWLTLTLWGATGVFLVPFAEEVIFRIGFLRSFDKISGCWVAIVASSALFASSHLGNILDPATFNLLQCAWLFVASLLIGTLTALNDGRIHIALAAHVGRNMIEFLTLSGVAIANSR